MSMVGVSYGPPFDRLTKSGTSYHLFTALGRQGTLQGVVNARPVALDYVEKAISFHPKGEVWRQRYHAASSPLAPVVKKTMSVLGARRAGKLARHPDALFQVSTWVDMSGSRAVAPKLRCCFLDGNVAAWLTRPDLVLDPNDKAVRRTLDFERRVFDNMDLILPKSEWARRSFIEDYGQDPDKVIAVGNGANLDRIPDPVERDFTSPRLLFVGKNFSRKGGVLLLDAFDRVREAHPEAELWIAGPQSLPRTPQGVRSFGLIRRDTPEGDAEMERLYREATGFVLPSRYEGFGIPFLEAMAYQLPCIGTDTCAIPEIIADGETGYLVRPDDVDQLAEKMVALIEDPARAKAMGEAGRQRFLERFTWDRVASRINEEVAAALERT
jgi:glycosyltransferase involved in cell wall biosynthesis